MKINLKQLKKIISQSWQVISKEGFSTFLSQAYEKTRKHEFRIIEPIIEPIIDEKISLINSSDLEKIKEECNQFEFKPKISIIMPVYKTKIKWLQDAIESVLAQAYQNWELCICDDGSNNDKLNIILNNYEKNEKRIKVTRLTYNQGISSASNKAIAIASGEFILFLSHDDVIAPNAIYEIVTKLNNNKNIDIFYSDEAKINDKGEYVEPFYKPDYSLYLLLSKNYIRHFFN